MFCKKSTMKEIKVNEARDNNGVQKTKNTTGIS